MAEHISDSADGVDASLSTQVHHAQFVSVVESIAAAKAIPSDAAASIVRSAVLTSLLLSSHRLAAISSHGSSSPYDAHVPYLPAVFTALTRMVSLAGRGCSVFYEGESRASKRADAKGSDDIEMKSGMDAPASLGEWYDGAIRSLRVDLRRGRICEMGVCFPSKDMEWIASDNLLHSYVSTSSPPSASVAESDAVSHPLREIPVAFHSPVKYQVSVRPVWCQLKGFPWWPAAQQLSSWTTDVAAGSLPQSSTASASLSGHQSPDRNKMSSAKKREIACLMNTSGWKSADDAAAGVARVEDTLTIAAVPKPDRVAVVFPADSSSSLCKVEELRTLTAWVPPDLPLSDTSAVTGKAASDAWDRLSAYKVLLESELAADKAAAPLLQALVSSLLGTSSDRGTFFKKVAKDKTCELSTVSKDVDLLYSMTLDHAILRTADNVVPVSSSKHVDSTEDAIWEEMVIPSGDPPHRDTYGPNLVGRWVAFWTYGDRLSDSDVAGKAIPSSSLLFAAEHLVRCEQSHSGGFVGQGFFDQLPACAFQPPSGTVAAALPAAVQRILNASGARHDTAALTAWQQLHKCSPYGRWSIGWVARYIPATGASLIVFDTPLSTYSCLQQTPAVDRQALRASLEGLLEGRTDISRRAWINLSRVRAVPLPIVSPLLLLELDNRAAYTSHRCATCLHQLDDATVEEHVQCTVPATSHATAALTDASAATATGPSDATCQQCGSGTPAGQAAIMEDVAEESVAARITAANIGALPTTYPASICDAVPAVKPSSGGSVKACMLLSIRGIRGIRSSCPKSAPLRTRAALPTAGLEHTLFGITPQKTDTLKTKRRPAWVDHTYTVVPGMNGYRDRNAATEITAGELTGHQVICTPCSDRFRDGCFCPVCVRLYDESSTDMLCCDDCNAWIHAGCDGMTLEDIAAIDQKRHQCWNNRYTCPLCRNRVLLKMLHAFRQEDRAGQFTLPVTQEQAPGYFNVINHPMDLLTMAANLDRGIYDQVGIKGANLFRQHFELIVRNALVFNTPQDRVYKDAWKLLRVGDALFEQLIPQTTTSVYRQDFKRLRDLTATSASESGADHDVLMPPPPASTGGAMQQPVSTGHARSKHANVVLDIHSNDAAAVKLSQLNLLAAPSSSTASAQDTLPIEFRPLPLVSDNTELPRYLQSGMALHVKDADAVSRVDLCVACMCSDIHGIGMPFACVDCGESYHAHCASPLSVARAMALTALRVLWDTLHPTEHPHFHTNVGKFTEAADLDALKTLASAVVTASAQSVPRSIPLTTLNDIVNHMGATSIPPSWARVLLSPTFAQLLRPFQENWRCSSCQICEVCGDCRPEHKSRLVSCEGCGAKAHSFCCKPVLVTNPTSWYCGRCVQCKSCKIDTKGSLATWSLRTDLCRDCHQAQRKTITTDAELPSAFGAIGLPIPSWFEDELKTASTEPSPVGCPVCKVVDTADTICCDACSRWIHVSCDPMGISATSYKVLAEFDSSLQYFCMLCRRSDQSLAMKAAREWATHVKRVRVCLRSMRSSTLLAGSTLPSVLKRVTPYKAVAPRPLAIEAHVNVANARILQTIRAVPQTSSTILMRRMSRCCGDKGYRSPLGVNAHKKPRSTGDDDAWAASLMRKLAIQEMLEMATTTVGPTTDVLDRSFQLVAKVLAARVTALLQSSPALASGMADEKPTSTSTAPVLEENAGKVARVADSVDVSTARQTAVQTHTPAHTGDFLDALESACVKHALHQANATAAANAEAASSSTAPPSTTTSTIPPALDAGCSRRCSLCGQGDDMPSGADALVAWLQATKENQGSPEPPAKLLRGIEGKLVPATIAASANATVATTAYCHELCALWSAEVYESSGDSLYGGPASHTILLHSIGKAIRRGGRAKCSFCGYLGASVSCCQKTCDVVYHLRCAVLSGCALGMDKRVFCTAHRTPPLSTAAEALLARVHKHFQLDMVATSTGRRVASALPHAFVTLENGGPRHAAASFPHAAAIAPLIATMPQELAALHGVNAWCGIRTSRDPSLKLEETSVEQYIPNGAAGNAGANGNGNAATHDDSMSTHVGDRLSAFLATHPAIHIADLTESLSLMAPPQSDCCMRVGGLTVLSWGSIQAKRPGFATADVIYPAGYKARRFWWGPSKDNKHLERCTYTLSVVDPYALAAAAPVDASSQRPLFIVQHDTRPALRVIATSPDSALLLLRLSLYNVVGDGARNLVSYEERCLHQPKLQSGLILSNLHDEVISDAVDVRTLTNPLQKLRSMPPSAIPARLRWHVASNKHGIHSSSAASASTRDKHGLTTLPDGSVSSIPQENEIPMLSGDVFFGFVLPPIRRVFEHLPDVSLLQVTPRGTAAWWPRYLFRYVQLDASALVEARAFRDSVSTTAVVVASVVCSKTQRYNPLARPTAQNQCTVLAARSSNLHAPELLDADRVAMGDSFPLVELDDPEALLDDPALMPPAADPAPSPAAPAAPLEPVDDAMNGGASAAPEVALTEASLTASYTALKSGDLSDRLVVRRSPIHGWGLFLRRDVPKNAMVIEYTGHLVRQAVADRRERLYEEEHRIQHAHKYAVIHSADGPTVLDPESTGLFRRSSDAVDALTMFDVPLGRHRSDGSGSCYLFRLDDEWIVDATVKGSAARFMNHCCEPNCYSEIVNIDGEKRIVVLALRELRRGEEVTYNYKFALETDPRLKLPCYCGAPTCPGTMN